MSQSLAKNYLHIIFSTKYREPLIGEKFEDELYSYLGGICNNLACYPVKIGGWYDHVHILCMLSKKCTLIKLLEEVKSHSSRWMKSKDPSLNNFYWQDGFGAFSVSCSDLDKVSLYISNQKLHHSHLSFQTEFRSILHKYHINFDERFVWD